MMNSRMAGIAITLTCALIASPAFAKSGKDKEAFRDGDCKVERKWKKDGRYKEKRDCRPAPYAVAEPYAEAQPQPGVVITLPPVVILPGRY